MTYELETQKSYSNDGDVLAAWVVYVVVVVTLVGYSLVKVFA